MNIVILAGGVGTRFWPLGRKNNPKQFFPMLSDKPLVKETYDRFAKKFGSKKIFFSVTADLYEPLKALFKNIPAKQFIVEPSRRDTAAAMGLAATYLFLQDPNEPMVFVPADHFIRDVNEYLRCFKVGEKIIKQTGKMVDIGIAATFPSTVLGYTKIGKALKRVRGVSLYEFEGHTEKPNIKTASSYLKTGKFLWHGNYYMWTPAKFLEAFGKYAPKIYRQLAIMNNLLATKKSIVTVYNKIEKISFDYAITEKIKKSDVLIIKGLFGWNDLGAWDVLYKQLRGAADKNGNVKRGRIISVNSRGNLLYGNGQKIMGVIGLKDMVVVDTEDALLVCHRNMAQDVKKLLPELEKQGFNKYL